MEEETIQLYTKVTEGMPTEFGYGPEWVAMAMYMDDFPRFYTQEEAIGYWNNVLKKEQEEYDRRKADETAEDYP